MAVPRNFDFLFVTRAYYEKLGHMLNTLAPRLRPDLSASLKDVAEKQVPTKPKPIAGGSVLTLHQCFLDGFRYWIEEFLHRR